MLLCAGCIGSMRPLGVDTAQPGLTPTAPTGPTDTGPLVVVALDSAQPTFGTAGTAVSITGGPFLESDTFRFDGEPATLLAFAEHEVLVAVPEVTTDGIVDITHQRGRGAVAPSPLAFRYFTSAEGGVGAVGLVARYIHVGGYWPAGVDDFASAEVWFPVGPALTYPVWRISPTIDSCSASYVPAPVDTYATGLSELTLHAKDDAGTRVVLPADGPGRHFSLLEAPLTDVPSGLPADLESTAASSTDWPALAVPEFVGEVGPGFVVTQPAIMGVTIPQVTRSFTLRWGGPYEGEVLLTLVRKRWNPSLETDEVQELVTCWLEDDGEHAVPDLWTEWAPFPANPYDTVDLVIGRISPPPAVLPHNRGASGVLGGTFIIGSAVAD